MRSSRGGAFGGFFGAASAAQCRVGAAACLLVAGCRKDLPAGDPARPDILLISIDSLRPDHLGAWGYDRPTSPSIDALAARGLRFDQARSASPWTLPSHMTMLTGLWPTEHEVIEDSLRLAPTVPLVTERLREAGYATGGFVSTIYVSHLYGFDRGFDRFEDYGITEGDNLHHPVHLPQETDDAWSFAAGLPAGKPAFIFLHTYDVHYPYLPPEPFNSQFDPAGTTKDTAYKTYAYFLKHPLPVAKLAHQKAQYDEAIAWVDQGIGAFVAKWEASGRKLNVLITADHGEELGERGSWGHGHTLYAEALRIPMVLVGPGIAPAVRHDRVGTIDVAATVAALAGLPWTGAGRDVRGEIGERDFYAETSRFDTNRLSLLQGPLRLDVDLVGHRRALYDTVADPGEQHDLAAGQPVDVDRLAHALFGALGEPWTLASGTVQTKGALWQAGAVTASPAPGTFGLWPPDAAIEHSGGTRATGAIVPPESAAWSYGGPHPSVSIALDDGTKAQLEALGYVQSEPKDGR